MYCSQRVGRNKLVTIRKGKISMTQTWGFVFSTWIFYLPIYVATINDLNTQWCKAINIILILTILIFKFLEKAMF